MVIESRITWDKLALELELLQKEEPKAVLPLFIAINSVLSQDIEAVRYYRTINFMSYDLNSRCQNKTDFEKVEILNQYFFQEKEFVLSFQEKQRFLKNSDLPEDLMIFSVLENKTGHSLLLSVLYTYLAQNLDLPIIHFMSPHHHILKWVRASKCCYLDLSKNAQPLNDSEVLKILSLKKCETTQPSKSLLLEYLSLLKNTFMQTKKFDWAHASLTMLLKVEPTHLQALGERALVRKSLGYLKEAQQDLKRYFSFVDPVLAPHELQSASKEIQGLLMDTPEAIH